jgi:hypothetical protein
MLVFILRWMFDGLWYARLIEEREIECCYVDDFEVVYAGSGGRGEVFIQDVVYKVGDLQACSWLACAPADDAYVVDFERRRCHPECEVNRYA